MYKTYSVVNKKYELISVKSNDEVDISKLGLNKDTCEVLLFIKNLKLSENPLYCVGFKLEVKWVNYFKFKPLLIEYFKETVSIPKIIVENKNKNTFKFNIDLNKNNVKKDLKIKTISYDFIEDTYKSGDSWHFGNREGNDFPELPNGGKGITKPSKLYCNNILIFSSDKIVNTHKIYDEGPVSRTGFVTYCNSYVKKELNMYNNILNFELTSGNINLKLFNIFASKPDTTSDFTIFNFGTIENINIDTEYNIENSVSEINCLICPRYEVTNSV